uniref:MHC class I H2-TL-T17-c mRNA (d haplotype) n=1 Tax=Mus musculus TaxID=10090 RepID=Q31207_MOUSE|nr:MHC H2-TL-T17-c [Mus musculus]
MSWVLRAAVVCQLLQLDARPSWTRIPLGISTPLCPGLALGSPGS